MSRPSSPFHRSHLSNDELEMNSQSDAKEEYRGLIDTQHVQPASKFSWVLESPKFSPWTASSRKRRYLLGSIIAAVLLLLLVLYPSFHSSHKPPKDDVQRERSHWTSYDDINTVFSFGDSWSSLALKVCPAFNSSEEHNPSDPAYPGKTSTGGPNWIGFLTHEFNRSRIHLHDLAIGGSTIDNATVHGLFSHDLVLETEYMVAENMAHAPVTLPSGDTKEDSGHCVWMPRTFDPDKSLFSIFFGMNDIGACDDYNHCDLYNPPIPKIFDSYGRSLTKLYRYGARNFLLLNAPSISSLTALDLPTNDNKTHAQARATRLFNEAHKRLAQRLREDFPGTTVFEVDVFTLMNKVYHSPHDVPYTDFKNITGSCPRYSPSRFMPGDEITEAMINACGGLRPEDYLWSGGLHTSWPFHKAIAKTALDVMDAYRAPG